MQARPPRESGTAGPIHLRRSSLARAWTPARQPRLGCGPLRLGQRGRDVHCVDLVLRAAHIGVVAAPAGHAVSGRQRGQASGVAGPDRTAVVTGRDLGRCGQPAPVTSRQSEAGASGSRITIQPGAKVSDNVTRSFRQIRAWPTVGYARSGIQITGFGASSGGCLNDQVAGHIGGSGRVLPDCTRHSASACWLVSPQAGYRPVPVVPALGGPWEAGLPITASAASRTTGANFSIPRCASWPVAAGIRWLLRRTA